MIREAGDSADGLHALDRWPTQAQWASMSDEALAQVIFAVGHEKLRAGAAIDLSHVVPAEISDERNPVALDAAIAVTLRSLRAGGAHLDEAASSLVALHPRLEVAIREAALMEGVFPPDQFGATPEQPRLRELPSDFGPALPGGGARYRLMHRAGRGGFGDVFVAEDRHLAVDGQSPVVAIKLARLNLNSVIHRYSVAVEAARARRVIHDAVVRVIDRGSTPEGDEYIVTEYIEGGVLTEWAGPDTPGERARAVALMGIQLARGLHAIHKEGLVHRDLKPDNILLTPDGRPKIADFGIALPVGASERGAYAASGPLTGNIAFMAPERLRGEPQGTSPAADIYALGGILLHVLCKGHPLGTEPEEIIRAARNRDRTLGDVRARLLELSPRTPRPLIGVLAKCLAPDQDDRYQSALAVADDLQRWIDHQPIQGVHDGVLARGRLWAVRNKFAAALAVLVGFAALAGALAYENWRTQEIRKASLFEAIRIADTDIARFYESGIDSRYLSLLWALEWVLDRSMVFGPDNKQFIWDLRMEYVQRRVEIAESSGHGDDAETWMWRLAQVYWEINFATHNPETVVRAATARERLREKLGGNDSMTRLAESLHWCARVKELTKRSDIPDRRAFAIALHREHKQLAKRNDPFLNDQSMTRLSDRARVHLNNELKKLDLDLTAEPPTPVSDEGDARHLIAGRTR